MSEGKKTRLVTAGRNKKWTLGVVNPPSTTRFYCGV
ncbi:cystathionine beta-lyase [Vibrio cholerae]|nr:hypothetical protein VcPa15_02489 [Vibrio cholerae]CSD24231.1 cystathionine beta-lyase [Vibrio cholerae]